MKYLGLSNDEKFLFTDKGFYLLEETEKFVPYNNNILSELYKIKQSDSEYQYNKGVLSLTEWVSTPRKFLNMVIESFDLSSNDKMNVLIEWDKKFNENYLINETTNRNSAKTLINESWIEVGVICEGVWDNIKTNAGNVWGKVKQGASNAWGKVKQGVSAVAQKVIIPVLKQGVLPFLRWVRRNLNTYAGIIADVILSMFPTVIVMRAIWGLIVILDIYEIITNDYDPNDQERAEMPFLFLMTDVLSLAFTAAAGKAAGVTLKQSIKLGGKSPVVKGIITRLLEKLPLLSKLLGDAQKFITKVFGTNVGKFIGTVFSGIDTVITKMISWVSKTFGISGLKHTGEVLSKTGSEIATKKGLGKLAVGTGLGVGLAELFKEKTIGEGAKSDKVKKIQQGLLKIQKYPTNMGGVPTLKFKGPVNGVFGPDTTTAIKEIQRVYKLPITGKVDPKLAFAFGIELEPSGFEKIVPKDVMDSFGKRLMGANSWLESKFGKYKGIAK
jgi:hypothetical protein